MRVLVILTGAFLITYLINRLYARFWEKSLEVCVDFQKEPAFEGEEAILTETILNRKWLFLPVLSVGFQISRNLVFPDGENASVSDLSYKRDIFSVGSYQKITRNITFQCRKRGYYELDKIELVTRNPLMTGRCYGTLPCYDALYVLPGSVQQNRLEIPFQKIMGSVTTKKSLYEDPFEFRGIREYQPTDPMNRINWKASARSSEWMVNLYDSTCSQEIRILLDLEEETIWKYNEIHEEGIRIAAALMEKCVGMGIPASLMTNGHDVKTKELFSLSAGMGQQQVQNAREGLARIDLDQSADSMDALLDLELNKMEKVSCTYVMIAKNQQMSKYEKLEKLVQQGAGGIWISVLHDDMERTLPKEGKIQLIYWEVPK